jgi:hypothetical protein
MKPKLADLPPWPAGWGDVTITRETKEVYSVTSCARHELVPFKQGGAELCARVQVACDSVNLDELFFAHGILWRIIYVGHTPTHLEIRGQSVASLSDLIELIPSS